MSKIAFAKYSALGNDFILFEKKAFLSYFKHRDLPETIRSLCHRRRSIGADGILLYEALGKKDHFAIEIYNSDGSNPALCGNGLRSLAHFLANQTHVQVLWIQSRHFLHCCTIIQNSVTCTMMHPSYKGEYTFSKEEDLKSLDWHLMECGVPHIISILPSIQNTPLDKLGRALQSKKELGVDTVNVSVLELLPSASSHALIRTYERGVFAETGSCGTAAMSAAALLKRLRPSESQWTLSFVGFPNARPQEESSLQENSLEVSFEGECSLKGRVECAFEGTISK